MCYQVVITKRAQDQLMSIRNYLDEQWGESVTLSFQSRVNDVLDLLTYFPNLGSLEVEGKGIRGLKLTKQIRMFYRLTKKKIIILAFFDVRQNPQKRTE